MKKILVVDDEAGLTRLLKLNLERTGRYTVRVVNDSTQAMEAVRQFRPDLILLDFVMPDLDGGEIAARLKADPELAGIAILFLTAIVSPGDVSEGAVVMSADHLMIPKPVNMQTLLAAIEDRLGTA